MLHILTQSSQHCFMKKILIIEKELSVEKALTRLFDRHQYHTESCRTGTQAIEKLQRESFHVIISNTDLNDMDSRAFLAKAKILHPAIAILFIADQANIRTAIELVKAGACNYLPKPLYPDEILSVVDEKLSENGMQQSIPPEKHMVADPCNDFCISRESAAAQKLYQYIDIVAPTNYSVVIYGETGTGKEFTARLIHEKSKHAKGPFVAIDCGSLSRELAASELFGHEKGAFTGAVQAKEGAFELANGGTLFLDEISNLSYDIQAYLLRALQEKLIRRVGGVKEIPVKLRIIAASNKNLYDAVVEEHFREDLFHRLNEFALRVPPLRDREDDIATFANAFLQQANQQLNKGVKGFSDAVWDLFHTYSWPGNIRELKNAINHACLLTPDNQLVQRKSLPLEVMEATICRPRHNGSEGPAADDQEPDIAHDLKHAAQQAEYEKIAGVLREVRYNKTKAAALLNINRKTLYNKLRMLG
jgi:two-component system response regulator HydG